MSNHAEYDSLFKQIEQAITMCPHKQKLRTSYIRCYCKHKPEECEYKRLILKERKIAKVENYYRNRNSANRTF